MSSAQQKSNKDQLTKGNKHSLLIPNISQGNRGWNKEWEFILVSQGCHNKVTQLGFKQQNPFRVLKSISLKSRCWHGCFLLQDPRQTSSIPLFKNLVVALTLTFPALWIYKLTFVTSCTVYFLLFSISKISVFSLGLTLVIGAPG